MDICSVSVTRLWTWLCHTKIGGEKAEADETKQHAGKDKQQTTSADCDVINGWHLADQRKQLPGNRLHNLHSGYL